MGSRANISKRGSTWTFYVYVTGGDGRRRQASKGGFRTRKEAEAARVEALNAMRSGSWVRPERVTVREFLEDEWLPTQLPPTLEESTYRSYARYVRLHVIPYIGGIPLQQVTPMVWAVSDLGLARRNGPSATTTLTETGEGVGSRWFTAPEQWTDAKSVSETADIFGLGRVLHVLLTGEEGPVTDINHDGLRAVVRRATDTAPSRRYRSVATFLNALDDAASSPTGRWRTRSEEFSDLRQRLGERLHSPSPDPSAVAEARDLIAASVDDDEVLGVLDHAVPYLPGPTVVDLWQEDPDGWQDFLARLADHMRHRGYDFSFTDEIAAFLRRCLTASDDDPEVMRSSVFALIGVGTRHNRWRVRDTVASILQSARTAEQALALAEAIRASDYYDVHWTVEGVSLATLHPVVAAAIDEMTADASSSAN